MLKINDILNKTKETIIETKKCLLSAFKSTLSIMSDKEKTFKEKFVILKTRFLELSQKQKIQVLVPVVFVFLFLISIFSGSDLEKAKMRAFQDASKGNLEDAFEFFLDNADKDSECARILGDFYESGIYVEQNYLEAVKWYRKAAEKGDTIALKSMGDFYISGKGVTEDHAEAVKWYIRAAKNGSIQAQFELGECYRNGIGVEENYVEAINWYQKATNAKNDFDADISRRAKEKIKQIEQQIAEEKAAEERRIAKEERRIAEKKAEEERRIAEEKAKEERRIAEEKAKEERRIAREKAAEERRIAREKAEEERRIAREEEQNKEVITALYKVTQDLLNSDRSAEEFWFLFSGTTATAIAGLKTYEDIESVLRGIKLFLLHDNNDGTVLLDEFASEYLPNTYSKYEKAREKSLESGQNLKSVFTKQLDINSPEWSNYIKAAEKYSQILWEEKRIQNDISYIYMFHKVGAMSDEKLAELDKLEKKNFVFDLDFKHDLNQYQTKKVDGVMEFAQKNMPETFALLETFEKEIKETKLQFDGLYADAKKLNYLLGNTTHPVFVAFEFKYKKTIDKYNVIMLQVKDLQVKHLLSEVTGEYLASQDSKIAKEHKAFKESLPELVKNNANKCGSLYVQEIIETMVQIPNKDYLMGKYEVTQGLWQAIMGKNPSEFKMGNNPVECVSWKDCQKFIEKLNALPEVKQAGLTFFLPTAEQWEYACRAGSTGDYGLLADGREGTFGEMGWHSNNSGYKTHPVGQKKPNAWGLYDMHGNVWEWTASSEHDGDRIYYGGGWNSLVRYSGADRRDDSNPDSRGYDLGFRLAASRIEK